MAGREQKNNKLKCNSVLEAEYPAANQLNAVCGTTMQLLPN